jgi:hypothetical protein
MQQPAQQAAYLASTQYNLSRCTEWSSQAPEDTDFLREFVRGCVQQSVNDLKFISALLQAKVPRLFAVKDKVVEDPL